MYHLITSLFGGMRDRHIIVNDFNKLSKNLFIKGENKIMLEAKITNGYSNFRHSFSAIMQSGFRVKALTDSPLLREELVHIGKKILANEIFVRELVSNGFDTFEVYDTKGSQGCKWALKNYIV